MRGCVAWHCAALLAIVRPPFALRGIPSRRFAFLPIAWRCLALIGIARHSRALRGEAAREPDRLTEPPTPRNRDRGTLEPRGRAPRIPGNAGVGKRDIRIPTSSAAMKRCQGTPSKAGRRRPRNTSAKPAWGALPRSDRRSFSPCSTGAPFCQRRTFSLASSSGACTALSSPLGACLGGGLLAASRPEQFCVLCPAD